MFSCAPLAYFICNPMLSDTSLELIAFERVNKLLNAIASSSGLLFMFSSLFSLCNTVENETVKCERCKNLPGCLATHIEWKFSYSEIKGKYFIEIISLILKGI